MESNTPPGEPSNHRLLEYKLEVITKNLDKLEGSMKELAGVISSAASQQISRAEWKESQENIKSMQGNINGLSIWRWMMAGVIAAGGFSIPILLALYRIGK